MDPPLYSLPWQTSPTGDGRPGGGGVLNYLAGKRAVAAATQNQALHALLFLYDVVLERKLGVVEGLQRVRRPPKLPVVLDKVEVAAVLRELSGQYRLMADLLYGSGLRLLECLSPCIRRRRRSSTIGKGRRNLVKRMQSNGRAFKARALNSVVRVEAAT